MCVGGCCLELMVGFFKQQDFKASISRSVTYQNTPGLNGEATKMKQE